MKSDGNSFSSNLARLLVLTLTVVGSTWALGQPAIISVDPEDNATQVPVTTPVVFTFNTAMDTDMTFTTFYDEAFAFITTVDVWSAGNTVLTCTPDPGFTADSTIFWIVQGNSAMGEELFPEFGGFSTSVGSGTNATTTFSVGKVHHYNQTSAGAPTLDLLTPYGFAGVTSLASDRTANSVTLTNPVGATFNLFHLPPPSADVFILSTNFTSVGTFDTTFPAGNYGFFVQAQASNQSVILNLPTTTSMPQPSAPHLTNYVAAQAINPSQPFVLGWDAFVGGATTNYIDVDVDGAINSPEPGQPGALNGLTRTFTIPAGTLLPGSTYNARIGFFRHVGTTNVDFTTAAFRATYTEFTLITTGGLRLTNAVYTPQNFSFEVLNPGGSPVTVEFKTNLNSGVWHTLLVTNNPPTIFRAVAPQSTTNQFLFFRARSGPDPGR